MTESIDEILEELTSHLCGNLCNKGITEEYKSYFDIAKQKILERYCKKLTCEELVKPKQLHDWYLEATSKLHPDSYNPKAQMEYEFLSNEQQFIDEYIANKINQAIINYLEHNRKE